MKHATDEILDRIADLLAEMSQFIPPLKEKSGVRFTESPLRFFTSTMTPAVSLQTSRLTGHGFAIG